jgi:hypothetical protein
MMLAPPASAVVIVDKVVGRKVVTYMSGAAKWTASAQAEIIDPNYVTKPDPDHLRGRAAVQETTGISRVRIYDVKLQQRGKDGVWRTVAQNLTDAVNSSARAYAKSYTPPVEFHPFGDRVLRRFRVVNHHGVRRSDGAVANRTTVSSEFLAAALVNDPDVPDGELSSDVYLGETPWQEPGAPHEMIFEFSWVPAFYPDQGPAEGVSARVIFSPGLHVDSPGEGFTLDETTPDPNDYIRNFGTVTDVNIFATATFTVTPESGGQWISADLSTTTPNISSPARLIPFEVATAHTVTINGPDTLTVGEKAIYWIDAQGDDPDRYGHVSFSAGLKAQEEIAEGLRYCSPVGFSAEFECTLDHGTFGTVYFEVEGISEGEQQIDAAFGPYEDSYRTSTAKTVTVVAAP